MNKIKKINLEKTFDELSDLIKKIEDENIDIDEMINLFNKGMSLAKLCEEKLSEAEKKVNILLKEKK